MRDIKVLRVYNLVDSKGNKLQLRLGVLKHRAGEVCISNADRGYRWSFIGENIPMPVRSMYWFNGFEESIMLDWLKANGWCVHTRVEMDNGKTKVYELPKGNNESVEKHEYELPANALISGEAILKETVCQMCSNGNVLKAVSLYRYVHPSSLLDAKHAVDKIRLDAQI